MHSNKKSLALDLHGIINTAPDFFGPLTQSLVKDGWEIHVLTGSHIKENNIEEELKSYGIKYTHLFSIADYHRENQTTGMWYDKNGDPWVSDEDWDKTKAEYCKRNEISFCIDDTARYANYFETSFGYMSIQTSKKKPNKYLNLIIDMFEKRRKEKNDLKSKQSSPKNWYQKFNDWVESKCGWFLNPASKQGKEERNSKYQ